MPDVPARGACEIVEIVSAAVADELSVDRPATSIGTQELIYRPHLDGLRALAVYLVVLFHAGSGWFSGGFVGVDVFFVLSGFLVTQLLLRDLARSGSIGFGRFYARRYRRLLPAAFVALTVTALVYTAIASPAEVLDAVGSFKAAFLYVTNWYFIHRAAGYFGASITADPVLPFWSLAIEEQFYLLWPLVLGGMFSLSRRLAPRRRLSVVRGIVIVGALSSALWALSLRHSDPDRAYYGTETRAYELLAGALIALLPTMIATAQAHPRITRGLATAATIGLLFIASSALDLDAIERGIAATLTTGMLLVALEAADGGLVTRALSHDVPVYLGKVSYGTYLWHWLIIIVIVRFFHLSTVSKIAITAVLATALASLSYQLLEGPIRASVVLDHHPKLVIAVGVAISVVSATVLIPKVVNPAKAAVPILQGKAPSGGDRLPSPAEWRGARRAKHRGMYNCVDAPVERCTIVRGSGAHVLLIGDSQADMLAPTFAAIARKEGLSLSVQARGACPWQRQLNVRFRGKTSGGRCHELKEDLYNRVIPALEPDVIVAANLAYQGSVRTTPQSLDELAASGRKIVLVEPIPVSPVDPIDCLSSAKVLQECAYVAEKAPSTLDKFFRRLAKQHPDEVFSLDLDRLICPFFPICDAVVDGQIVKSDRWHLTPKFATAIAPEVGAYLQQLGALPRR
jgi:peptidoglycan/LPS O-acetylase OafA/YrhL